MITRNIEGGDGVGKYLAKEPKAPSVDLREQTYHLLSQVREPSTDEKEALKGRGIVFLPVASKSYAQVVSEDPAWFWDKELKYANARAELRDYVLPVAVEIGLRLPSKLSLPNSYTKSRKTHLEMIDAYSQELQAEFPDARAIMLPSTGYAQADRAYKAVWGSELFWDEFTFALDNLYGVFEAAAGRHVPSDKFRVGGWFRRGHPLVGAVPAVVFIGNK